MSTKRKYLRKYLNLRSTIDVEETNNDDAQTVFCFTNYLNNFKELFPKLKTEITINHDNKDSSQYELYVLEQIKLLDEYLENIDVSIGKIKYWFDKFGSEYEDFISILELDKDSDLYYFLNVDERNGVYINSNEVQTMQMDFLHFSKKESTKLIKKFMEYIDINGNSKRINQTNTMISSEIKKFPDYFEDQYLEKLEFLVKFFKRPKEFAIMTCLLTQNNIVSIKKGERTNFFRAWYDFIDLDYPNKDNFYSTSKHISDKSTTGYVYKDEFDVDYLELKKEFEDQFIKT